MLNNKLTLVTLVLALSLYYHKVSIIELVPLVTHYPFYHKSFTLLRFLILIHSIFTI